MRRRAAIVLTAAGLAGATAALALGGGEPPPAPTAAAPVTAPAPGTAPAAGGPPGAGGQPAGGERAARLAEAGIIDLPVRFTVTNTNRSRAACTVDGRTYTLRGHLTAPAALLDGQDRAVTLYQHGIAAGEWYWRIGVQGYDHAEEMARRGHASLTVDRLGYGESDLPHGLDTCVGGGADIAHQLVQQLRTGTFEMGTDGAWAAGPRFDRVVLAGQSNGGQIAQIAAYSFGDVDGLVLLDWTDLGLTPQANARFASSLQVCLRGGSPAEDPDDPTGYAFYDAGTEQFRAGNFADTDPVVLAAALAQQNRHPCGDMVSQLGATLVDLRHLRDIRVPVLFVYGERDARVQGGAEHAALFTGAEDTTLVTVPGAGHYAGLERGATIVHDTLASWLDERGL